MSCLPHVDIGIAMAELSLYSKKGDVNICKRGVNSCKVPHVDALSYVGFTNLRALVSAVCPTYDVFMDLA